MRKKLSVLGSRAPKIDAPDAGSCAAIPPEVADSASLARLIAYTQVSARRLRSTRDVCSSARIGSRDGPSGRLGETLGSVPASHEVRARLGSHSSHAAGEIMAGRDKLDRTLRS